MKKHIAVSKLRFFAAAAICALAAIAVLAPAASAAPVIDQSNTGSPTDTWNFGWMGSASQTFTAGMTGTLDEVELNLYNPSSYSSTITVQITSVTSGAPNFGDVLGSGTVDPSTLPTSGGSLGTQVEAVTLSSPAQVVTGTQYAIVLTTTGGSVYYVWRSTNDNYAGGLLRFNSTTSWSSEDYVFATYVEAPSTPTPTAATRGAYCTVADNTTDGGLPLLPGTFVNLDDGQASSDPHYAGAEPANFVQGVGLTCAAPPTGYTRHGYATADMNVDANTYPYYAAA